MGAHILLIFGAWLGALISVTYSPKGIVFPYKPLIGIDVMSLPDSQISQCFSAAFTQQVTRLSS